MRSARLLLATDPSALRGLSSESRETPCLSEALESACTIFCVRTCGMPVYQASTYVRASRTTLYLARSTAPAVLASPRQPVGRRRRSPGRVLASAERSFRAPRRSTVHSVAVPDRAQLRGAALQSSRATSVDTTERDRWRGGCRCCVGVSLLRRRDRRTASSTLLRSADTHG